MINNMANIQSKTNDYFITLPLYFPKNKSTPIIKPNQNIKNNSNRPKRNNNIFGLQKQNKPFIDVNNNQILMKPVSNNKNHDEKMKNTLPADLLRNLLNLENICNNKKSIEKKNINNINKFANNSLNKLLINKLENYVEKSNLFLSLRANSLEIVKCDEKDRHFIIRIKNDCFQEEILAVEYFSEFTKKNNYKSEFTYSFEEFNNIFNQKNTKKQFQEYFGLKQKNDFNPTSLINISMEMPQIPVTIVKSEYSNNYLYLYVNDNFNVMNITLPCGKFENVLFSMNGGMLME